MKFRIILILLCTFLFNIAFAQHTDEAKTKNTLQKKWLKKTASEMKKFLPDTASGLIVPFSNEAVDFYQISYRLKAKGWIKFENGEWIYLISSSNHDNPEIGDITIAMDNKKKFYINRGHVCGGIIHFECSKKMATLTSDIFFKEFYSDTDKLKWETYK